MMTRLHLCSDVCIPNCTKEQLLRLLCALRKSHSRTILMLAFHIRRLGHPSSSLAQTNNHPETKERVMSVTSIQFIGLFVVMMNSGAGIHILLPHFPGTPYADHVSMIQYNPQQVLSTTWPGVTACGFNNSMRCAPIGLETITFAGAIDPAPTDIIGDMPHLRCCCASMTDILPKYKDPTATDKV